MADTPRTPAFQTSRRPVNHRRANPRPVDTAARNAVGGGIVHSMKRRGLRPSKWVENRPWILAAVALVLLCVLNAAWLYRINRRIGSQGGWSSLAASACRHIAGWVSGLAARIDSGSSSSTVPHDEM